MSADTNVGAMTFQTPTDEQLVAIRTLDAPKTVVWKAITDPEHVPNWMLGPDDWTMPTCEVDLRVGGKWRFVFLGPDGAEMAMSGEYREIEPVDRLVNTECWGDGWPETLCTVELTEDDGKTTVTTVVQYPSREDRDKAVGIGMKEGWAMCYDRLDAYLPSIS